MIVICCVCACTYVREKDQRTAVFTSYIRTIGATDMVRRTLLVLALLVLAAAFRPLAPRARSVRLQCEQKFKNFDDMLANIETPGTRTHTSL